LDWHSLSRFNRRQQQLASGPCHFGPIVHLLEFLSEALHRHKDCPKPFSANLALEVQELFSNGSRAQNQLLVGAVKRGAERAATTHFERPLNSVQVLMCSEPPWIAHLQDWKQTAVELEGVKSAAASNMALSESSTVSNRDDGDKPF
jgi:hypothetical protein